MSTHKYIDKICCVILALTLLLTVVFINADFFGIQSASKTKGYETRIFDTSQVHTLNIVMDDWDEFIENCTDEEYVSCAVVIDNESYKNVAIRAKGNTSLSNVQSYGNDRYSFKIEFDHYDSTKSYHGLDKLSLNNIIQDNTYIKDYLCYQMMGYFGADAPLCSFVQINVNGEEWGLYLAVEGIEDSFLERNYGNNYGELYKPDSQSMGGGRGNGGNFNMDDWKSDEDATAENASENGGSGTDFGTMQKSEQGGFGRSGNKFNISLDEAKNILAQMDEDNIDQIASALGYEDSSELTAALDKAETLEDVLNGKDLTTVFKLFMQQGGMGAMPSGDNDFGAKGGDKNGGMGGGMGSDDVKLIYTDDNYSSYSNIFGNAKTDVTDADKDRLIASLKSLNENTDIENVVNIDEVIRYFVVHNFVCNFDSYTGSMIHNYYLYEENGKLSMIPWDYNLAFGGFSGGGDATGTVNYPIDSPVSGGTVDSRPMLAWIFNNEEYTEIYHQYFADFISEYFDSGYFSEMIDSLKEMLSPYVESDPTKFCTYEEFEKGIDTLKEFCLLRAESVNGQLDGTIPSTSEGQSADKTSLIDASNISISDMGSMGGGMKGGMDRPDNSDSTETPEMPSDGNNIGGSDSSDSSDATGTPQMPDGNGGMGGMGGFNGSDATGTPQMPDGNGGMGRPGGFNGSDATGTPQMPDGNGGMGGPGGFNGSDTTGTPQMPDGNGGMGGPGGFNGSDATGTPQMPNNNNGTDAPDDSNGFSTAEPPEMPNGGTENGMSGDGENNMPDMTFGDGSNKGEAQGNSSGEPSGMYEKPHSDTNNTEKYILFGVSCLVLAAGLAIVLIYKKRR